MTSVGFEEAQAEFLPFGVVNLRGQVRRFGPQGPAYEVIDVKPSGDVLIEVIESGERLLYARHDCLLDPIAITVP